MILIVCCHWAIMLSKRHERDSWRDDLYSIKEDMCAWNNKLFYKYSTPIVSRLLRSPSNLTPRLFWCLRNDQILVCPEYHFLTPKHALTHYRSQPPKLIPSLETKVVIQSRVTFSKDTALSSLLFKLSLSLSRLLDFTLIEWPLIFRENFLNNRHQIIGQILFLLTKRIEI